MNQSFFIGAIGAHQQQQRLGLHGNNIANVNTYGFKADKGRFANLMYTDIKNAEEDMIHFGVGGALWSSDTDFTQGTAAATGRDQDYMIEGPGFFALADLESGEITLTRSGAFVIASLQRPTEELDEFGEPVMEQVYYLSDGEGRFVLDNNGNMIEVSNEDRDAELPIGVFDYINYNGMEHASDSSFVAVEKNGAIRVGTGKVIRGMLESSNVDLAEEMTKVIESQRAYSMALKMVQTSDEIETTINSLRN